MDPARLLRMLIPPACVVCRSSCRQQRSLCDECVLELNSEEPVWGDPPPGLDDCIAAFRHEGVARGLLHALKFGRMAALAPLAAGYMTENVAGLADGSAVVPVPSSWLRRTIRGFDPAALLAREIARELPGCRFETAAIRRIGLGRQRGGNREARLASPPLIRPSAHSTRLVGPVLLVDDVITTGATVTACATALKRLGAGPVTAIGLTRRV